MIFVVLMLGMVGIYAIFNPSFLQKIKAYTYFGLRQKFHELEESYDIKQYLFHSVVIMGGLLIFYQGCLSSVQSLIYLGLMSIASIPYLVWLRRKQIYDYQQYQEVLLYVSSGIIFIQEQKNSVKILKESAELIRGQLSEDISLATKHIDITADFEEGLFMIEKRHPYAIIKKFHVLLRSVNTQGSYNESLYQYLYQSVESIEININEYIMKKLYQQRIFYLMWLLNFVAVISLISLFRIEINDYNEAAFNFMGSLFYALNLLSALCYEYGCSRMGVYS